MGRIRFGPARVPSRESPETAIDVLRQRGYDAREADIALSVHAPLFGFMGHLETSGRKFSSAVGALDRSAGIAAASGAEVVVFHPGFLLGREREDAITAVCDQLGTLRQRLEGKDRAVPFGIEVMGRVRDLGSLDDVLEISSSVGWVRPVLDFAHMHATSDGAFVDVDPFADALERADAVLEPGAPFHIHFSDIAFANRNETKHLPYGEGTLRAEPLGEALSGFERPATVISEAPDIESSFAIREALVAGL